MSIAIRSRRSFIGGSDARVIMGDDEAALLRLWREKRGEVEPEDLSDNLIVQLGAATEELNRLWYRAQYRPGGHGCAAAGPASGDPLDGRDARRMVEATGAVFEAKFMLPWSFSEETAAEKHMAQLQHNMWVTNAKTAVLSIITGGGKWVEITAPGRSALSAPPADRREEVLALCRDRRAAAALRHRSAAGKDRGGAGR